jgi:hypothetical protein
MRAANEEADKELIGRRAYLVDDHPWKGHAGEIVGIEKTPFGLNQCQIRQRL